MNEYHLNIPSPVGVLTLASDGESLTGLWIEGQKYHSATMSATSIERDLPVFVLTRQWLEDYFNGEQPKEWPKLAPRGSAFRQKVWQALLQIPYGGHMSYGELAKKLNCPSARAVGGAVGHNPISIIIPCHRVMGADGSLTGYAGGIDRKRYLLDIEKTPGK